MAGKRKKRTPEEIRADRERSEAIQANLRYYIERPKAELADKRKPA
jgi:hypothetical protein